MHIVVIGSGAMGALFGGYLTANDETVTLVDVWAEHVEVMNRDGLTMETPDGDERTIDVEATTDPTTVTDADLALVFVKSTHTREAIENAAPVLEDVDVLSLQNGLGNAEVLAEYVPTERVIAGVTAHGSTLLGPGHIRHAGRGPTTIGRYFAETDDRVRSIADRFTTAGIETTVDPEIQTAIWEKVLVNVGINPITALGRVHNGRLADTEPGSALLEAAVEEGRAVAAAEGFEVREDIVAYVTEIAEMTGANQSSMFQDVEAARPTEIETLNGAVVARADEHGIEVPVNRTLVDLIRLRELGYEAEETD